MNPLSEKKVLDHGIVALMNVDGDDLTAATAARTSYRNQYGINGKTGAPYTDAENIGLTDYLIRNRHSTPVEFPGATFYMVMPIFVARQMIRHRTAVVNEESLRYVDARDEFYVPELDRMQKQSTSNKQGSSIELVDDPVACRTVLAQSWARSYSEYQYLLKQGMARELAREVLPLGTYTAWYWKANLHNVFHLLGLRLDPHAQWEIRTYAEAMLELLRPHFPQTIASWENHVFSSLRFSQDEQALLRAILKGMQVDMNEDVSYFVDAVKYEAEQTGFPKSRIVELVQKLSRLMLEV